MTTQQHPITPPPEMVEQWRDLPEYTDGRRKMIMVTLSSKKLLDIATQAARWGADQELEACCEWLGREVGSGWGLGAQLRDARRPKPPSLKEQALAELAKIDVLWDTDEFGDETNAALDTIRRALEQLND